MPSPKTTPASRIVLLDLHIRISVSNSLGLTILTGADNKLLALARGTPWAIAR